MDLTPKAATLAVSAPGTTIDQLLTRRSRFFPALEGRSKGWLLGLPHALDVREDIGPPIIAVGGGKGGVGKSLLAANLGAQLARKGLRVLVVDLDVGGANLHTYFGLGASSVGLNDVIVSQRVKMDDALVATAVENLYILPSHRDSGWELQDKMMADGLPLLPGLLAGARTKQGQPFDMVILDLGAGTHRLTMDFFCLAHVGLLTVLPEPTSIENAYQFLRLSLSRLVENCCHRLGLEQLLPDLQTQVFSETAGRTYVERLANAASGSQLLSQALFTLLAGRLVGLVVNQTRSQHDIDIGKSMEVVSRRFFGLPCQFLGYMNHDECAGKSLRNRRLLVIDFPQSLLARRLNDVAVQLLRGMGTV